MANYKQAVVDMLNAAGIQLNGDRPWDIQVHNQNLFQRVIKDGSLGAGEAYMDRWWDAEALDKLFYRVLNADLERKVAFSLPMIGLWLKSKFENPQSKKRAYEVGKQHYDKGNDLFEAMLDERMVYTTGYWQNASNLDEAQENKLDVICQQLDLQSGQHVLDIGCGWGSFAQYAAENYGVEVTGITVSREQAELARERCGDLPVEIRLQDYRKLDESFDHIVSLGMFEHVGEKNYRTFMRVVARCLSDDGNFVLNTIGGNNSTSTTDPWIEKYIFPNGMIPSVRQIGLASEELLVVEKWKNHGPDYDKTLMAWIKNFKQHWDELSDNYSDRFYRMWLYYLSCSAGSFRARKNHLWQITFSKY